MSDILQLLLHTEEFLLQWSQAYGTWIYFIIALIIFSETGLIVAALLPGDALLFAVGVMAAAGAINVWWLIPLLILAAILGNRTNYTIGRYFGHRILQSRWRLVQPKHLQKTHVFYETHGGKALVLGRFLPFARTLVPFLAGIGEMEMRTFQRYNLIGAVVWIIPFTLAGYWAGALQWVQDNFGLMYLCFLVITGVPLVAGLIRLRWQKRLALRKVTGS